MKKLSNRKLLVNKIITMPIPDNGYFNLNILMEIEVRNLSKEEFEKIISIVPLENLEDRIAIQFKKICSFLTNENIFKAKITIKPYFKENDRKN